jgi:ATP-dependent Clp protease ATP-binding subunit ClpA
VKLADGKIAFDITPSQKGGADKAGSKAEAVD